MANKVGTLYIVWLLIFFPVSRSISADTCNYVVVGSKAYATDVCITIQTQRTKIHKKYLCNGYEAIEQTYSGQSCSGEVIWTSSALDNEAQCGNVGSCDYIMAITSCSGTNASYYSIVPLVTNYCINVNQIASYFWKCSEDVIEMKIDQGGVTCSTTGTSSQAPGGCPQIYGSGEFLLLYCASIHYNITSTIPPTTATPTTSPTTTTAPTITTIRPTITIFSQCPRGHVWQSVMITIFFVVVLHLG
eukprot:548780_1